MNRDLNEESGMVHPTDDQDPKKRLARIRVRKIILILFTVSLFSLFLSSAFARPNGTETIITTDTAGFPDSTPVIYGDYIVCTENLNMLMMYNLASGENIPLPLTDPLAYYPAQPGISRNTVVWQEYDGSGYARIVRFDIPGGKIQDFYEATHDPTTMEFTYPKTDGTTLVWQNYNTTNSDWDIAVVRDGSSSPELILDSAGNEKHPSVSGQYVVYENWTDFDHSSVWRFNLTEDTSAPVFPSSDQETFPQASADRIVWQARDTVDTRSHINVWENGGITRLTPPGVDQEKPALFGNRIAVEDYRRNNIAPDVYVYEYTTSWKEIWVAPNDFDAAQLTPAIWNNRIVWEDTRSGTACGGCDSDVYLFTLGTSDSCPAARFTPSENAGPDPLTVTFTDHSAGSPILYRIWNYSDGTSSYSLDPAGQIFSGPGIYRTRLTVGNTKCRNVTPAIAKYDIYVDTPPDADFTATPREGFAPLAVQFTDVSGGNPASWTWNFGDGSFSHDQNPRHAYTTAGQTSTVSLTVNNTFAAMTPDTGTKTDYIRTFLGATGTATIPIQGITVIPRYGGWFLLYNATMLPDMVIPDPQVLSAFHPGSAGWQNITFISDDSVGFSDTFGNNTFMGNLSEIVFQTEDVTATGVSPSIGIGWGVSYRFENASYPSPALVSTAIWENTTAADRALFRAVIIGSNFIEDSNGIAYTARITKEGIHGDGNAVINMSVDSPWLGGKEAHTYVIGYGINSQGDTVGGVRPARFLFNDGTLDYFEADVPEYFSTFGISPLSGSGNPLQLVTLTIASHVSPENPDTGGDTISDDSGSGKGAGTKTANPASPPTVTASPTPVPADPGKSATIYTNANGVVTQATRLPSTDGRAIVSIPEGVVAKDDGGRPLSAITIRAVPSGSLPEVPSGSTFTFAGIAYEIGPDGATFSPPVSLAFILPQADWGQDYSVKSFDRMSGTWQDVPVTFDANSGTVTATVSHLCVFALFVHPSASFGTFGVTATVTRVPAPVTPQPQAPPPTTAVSIFMRMIEWVVGLVANNIVILGVVIIVIIAVYLYRQGKFPGLGR
jgi:PKD repeat protein